MSVRFSPSGDVNSSASGHVAFEGVEASNSEDGHKNVLDGMIAYPATALVSGVVLDINNGQGGCRQQSPGTVTRSFFNFFCTPAL